jgi:hypothetical protein
MKKIIFLLFLVVPLLIRATQITSISGSGYWSYTTSWVGGVVPGTNDTAIIATTSGHKITIDVTSTVKGLVVNNSAILYSGTLTVTGLVTNNGTIESGSSGLLYLTLNSGTVITGSGSWSGYVGDIYFQGSNQTIDASATVYAYRFVMHTSGEAGTVKVTNNGSVYATYSVPGYGGVINDDTSAYSSVWVNGANSYLSVALPSFTSTKDTLYASATGNTVVYGGTVAYNLKTPKSKTYYNLTISNSLVVDMLADYTANNVTVSSGATLNMSGDSLFLSGTWSHPGTVINHQISAQDTSIIKVSGTIVQKIPPEGFRITSISSTGAWSVATTWTDGLIPGILDTVVIATSSGEVNQNGTVSVAKVIVNSGALLLPGTITISTVLVNNGTIGGTISGGTIIFKQSSGTVLTGSGSWTTVAISLSLEFTGANETIDASVYFNPTAGSIILNTSGLGGTVKVTNNGRIVLSNATDGEITNNGSGSHSSVWVNAANSSVSVAVASWTTSRDTLYASASGDTVTYTGTSAITLKQPKNNTYYNLTINSTNTITLPSAITVSNNLTISGGTLACSTFQITGNTTGNFSMASGATLTIGSTTSTSNVYFPRYFTSAHISLNSNSTVTYQAKIAQTISDTATYGNLTVASGSGTTIKTPSGTPLNVGGNLTINTTTTLSESTNTLNVTGNTTITGTLSFSSGAFNFGGNFTNNGTFTYGTSTATFNGSGGGTQTIGGTTATAFYNLTGNSSGSETVALSNNDTVRNSFTISAGTFTWAGTGYTHYLKGSFTNSGTLNATSGTMETYGSGAQTLTGSATTTFYYLTIGTISNTTTLAGNIAVSATLTINSGSTLNAASYTITEAGNFTNNGTFTFGTSTFTLNGNSGQYLGGSPTTFYNLTGSSSGTETVTLAANETVSNNVTISSGTYTWSGTYTLNVHGNFTNNASFTAVQGIIIMNGGGTQTIGGSSSSTFNLLTCNGATVDLGNNETINGSLTISSGTLDVTASNWGLTIGVNFTANSTFNAENGTVTFNGPSNQAISGTSYPTFYNVTVSGSSGQIVALGANQTITNNLTITSGSLDVTTSNYSLTIGGAFAMNGGTFVPRTGTVYMTGGASTLGGTASLTLNNLVISSGATTLAGNITLNGNLTISSGASLDANSIGNYSITIAGNWTDNGTFYARNGTVNFDATGKQCVTTGETFKNMTISGVSILGTSSTISITGTITIIPGGQMACNC